jgi:hypothetical protein
MRTTPLTLLKTSAALRLSSSLLDYAKGPAVVCTPCWRTYVAALQCYHGTIVRAPRYSSTGVLDWFALLLSTSAIWCTGARLVQAA